VIHFLFYRADPGSHFADGGESATGLGAVLGALPFPLTSRTFPPLFLSLFSICLMALANAVKRPEEGTPIIPSHAHTFACSPASHPISRKTCNGSYQPNGIYFPVHLNPFSVPYMSTLLQKPPFPPFLPDPKVSCPRFNQQQRKFPSLIHLSLHSSRVAGGSPPNLQRFSPTFFHIILSPPSPQITFSWNVFYRKTARKGGGSFVCTCYSCAHPVS